MRRIRVLIVEDSPVVREHLRRIISADSRLEVAGIAGSGEEALALLDRISPDVISMDIHLPGMHGLEATRHIMSRRPTPIVVVSGIGSDDVSLSMQALKAGALAVVEKPAGASHQDYEAMAARLCTQLAIMSEVRVVRQRLVGSAPSRARGAPGPAYCAYRLIGVATSTGGPSALAELLSGLGPDFPLPVAVVQHMTPGFMKGFAEWLAGITPFAVETVSSRVSLLRGHVYLAPSDFHLVIEGATARLDEGPPLRNHRPSADVLFSSMARSLRTSAIGVLLTGMGDDGARGLRELRTAGGFTIAEDESSAVVYGMPGAGVRCGAVCESLPLCSIPSRIREMVSPRVETA